MLHRLPITTFGDIEGLGLGVEVWCTGCKRSRPLDLSDGRLRSRRFFGARLRCKAVRTENSGEGTRVCDAPGHPSVNLPERIPIRSAVSRAMLYCNSCHPSWEIHDVRLDQPPWSSVPLARGDRFRCPGCGGPVKWQWQGGGGTPFTEGYGR